ncbi:hypothetical protein QBC32DRAFT_375892 [Pseudoneurospora amorphoporcata]|uniref:Uncharacterized protein n=1 Tax=Pseudoneurospora amorphoporcata TaxID=241081 RepID=A0AAN6SEF8_9PEZI|nr:hypothetical protein QBC32DRAFT_375892 [Pseudoneurospora amorphoporcata]
MATSASVTTTPSSSNAQQSLKPQFLPSSLSSLAASAIINLHPQKVVHMTTYLHDAYISFSIPIPPSSDPNTPNPWAGFNPHQERKHFQCFLHLCDPLTGKSINNGRGGMKGLIVHQTPLTDNRRGGEPNEVVLGMAWRERDLGDKEYGIWAYHGVEEGGTYVPRFMAVYKGKRVDAEERKRPFFAVYGEPFTVPVVPDEAEVKEGMYDFRNEEEETWWWRVNREYVQNSIIKGPKTGQPTAQVQAQAQTRYQFVPGFGYDELPRGRGLTSVEDAGRPPVPNPCRRANLVFWIGLRRRPIGRHVGIG